MTYERKNMYSQGNEEKIILDYFQRHPALHKIFCDVGAFDGIGHSNVRALFELGWTGTLVEPDPNSFTRLQANYHAAKDIRLINAAVGSVEKRSRKITIHIPENVAVRDVKAWPYIHSFGELSTCVDHEMAKWVQHKIYAGNWKGVSVDLVSLNEILPPNTDFLSIDCEGMDFEVLVSAKLRFQSLPRLIMVEDNSNAYDCRTNCNTLLAAFGYKLIFTNTINSCWGLEK